MLARPSESTSASFEGQLEVSFMKLLRLIMKALIVAFSVGSVCRF
jgi:hypothetical protein